ncbi:TD and POZ domain-containing protein 3 [Caerostris extrusa]|uniref:TD and POZ domain-containing protein 3 n=1 Tax=Caerostris extrusa TaxID=172846 RepID=A0AAV4N5I0_CAEEX|nr:TD and POZ domain-containing protein 3 [Caerostris extrusa]
MSLRKDKLMAPRHHRSARSSALSPKSLQKWATDHFNLPPNDAEKKLENDVFGTCLTIDLLSLFRDGTLSDTKLVTSTETFPAHTQILAARSPVFRAMFSTDMKERNKGCVDIIDLDSREVRRMLLYMYTDTLEEDLEWKGACNLYAAADKYDIQSLKIRCLRFLQANFSPTNACNILIFADGNGYKDLKGQSRNMF